ncbi:DUF397 domain-containing protein [Nocardiopsis sp. FIRDI 009]|uniref:DUF397 domain-containing protein n=1 Tax=Nocardiopsis sp. FIRDI 009 TaxID=714197 RepID=UPI0013009DB0|nr:DUF397 domain-containing protein [Nocardiopsis sp. FIRDI 009]
MDEQTPRWFKSRHSSYVGACVEASLASAAGWRKSRHSSYVGECLEARLAKRAPVWFKSTHSSYRTANCVETSLADRTVLLLRDSMHPDGAVLSFGAVEWMGFVRRVTAQAG